MRNGRQQDSAAVLVFAVLLLAAGAFVLAGIAQLSATQAVVGQNEWESFAKRNMLENSRAMARQFMLTRMFNGVITERVEFTNVWGGFSLSPGSDIGLGDYWTTISESASDANLKINPFTLMERGGFYRVVVPGKLFYEFSDTGTNSVDWNFQVRTRSPVAAGYPYVQHRPGTMDGRRDSPYMDMNTEEKVDGFSEMARMPLSSVTNTNLGGGVIDSNGYQGFLAVPVGIASPIFFENNNVPVPQDENPTELELVVDLSAEDPGYIELSESGRALTYTVAPAENLTRLVLKGTEEPDLLPLQIIIPEDNTDLQTLVLQGRNSGPVDPFSGGRPVYVNFRRSVGNAGTVTVVATDFTGPWRIGISVQHNNINFETPGLAIIGGVRSDGSITGSPNLQRELDPLGFDFVADRMMWLEDHKTP
jgi:hypothetical protein